MARADLIEIDGIVVDIYPGSKFAVEIERADAKTQVTCTLSGKMRKNHIKIVRGDKVTINLSPYDLTKGILVWRYK